MLNLISKLIDPLVSIIKNFGLPRTIGYIVVVGCIIFTSASLLNIDKKIEDAITKNQEAQIIAHDKAVEKRYENNPKINNLLNEVLYRYGADRVCIIEMHNGTKNVAGLPFIYGEMTYEMCKPDILPVDSDYTEFNLSRLTFPSYMLKNNAFNGDIDELYVVDEKFAERISVNNTTYICGYTLHGSNDVIGYFGVVWCGGRPTETNTLMQNLAIYAQKLSVLLDEK